MSKTTAKPYYQRTSYRLLKGMFSHLNIAVGPKKLSVPLSRIAGLHLLHWSPGWHTTLIGHALARRPGAFVDVGVNVGQTLLDMISLNSPQTPYFGFEPNAHAVAYVSDIIERNRLDNIQLIPVGLSNSTRIERLTTLADSSVYSSAARINFGDSRERPLRHMYIPCYTFDSIRQSLHIPTVSMIKLDVEGEELAVLQGMTDLLKSDRPLIMCEVLHRDTDRYTPEVYRKMLSDFHDLLQTHRYVIYHIAKNGEDFHLELIDQFPDKVWVTPDSWTQCDYLLVPIDTIDWDLEQFMQSK